MERENVVQAIKKLNEIAMEFDYRTLEVAYLINDISQDDAENVTQKQVNKVANIVENADEIIDNFVMEQIYPIIN